ncbi:PsbP-related protein [Patescibacteria group bacterium]
MRQLIIFSVIIVLAAGIFGLAYPYASQMELALYGNRLTAQGSDLVGLESETVSPVDDVKEEQRIYRDWPMYANDKYDFSVRYPRDLRVNARAVELLRDSDVKTLVQFIRSNNSGDRGTSIVISVQPVAEGDNLDKIAKEIAIQKGKIVSQSEITVDGVRALRFWLNAPMEGNENLREDMVFVRKGDNILIFISAGQENRSLFEQILDTVNFHF